jgi:hypothetical protein
MNVCDDVGRYPVFGMWDGSARASEAFFSIFLLILIGSE